MLRLRLQRTFLHQFHNFNIVSTSHITERRIKNQPCTSAAEAICLGGGRGRSNCDLLPIWGWWRWQKHLEYLGISWNVWEFGIFLKSFSRFFMQRLGSGKVSSPWNWWVDYLLTHSNWLWVVEFQGIVFFLSFHITIHIRFRLSRAKHDLFAPDSHQEVAVQAIGIDTLWWWNAVVLLLLQKATMQQQWGFSNSSEFLNWYLIKRHMYFKNQITICCLANRIKLPGVGQSSSRAPNDNWRKPGNMPQISPQFGYLVSGILLIFQWFLGDGIAMYPELWHQHEDVYDIRWLDFIWFHYIDDLFLYRWWSVPKSQVHARQIASQRLGHFVLAVRTFYWKCAEWWRIFVYGFLQELNFKKHKSQSVAIILLIYTEIRITLCNGMMMMMMMMMLLLLLLNNADLKGKQMVNSNAYHASGIPTVPTRCQHAESCNLHRIPGFKFVRNVAPWRVWCCWNQIALTASVFWAQAYECFNVVRCSEASSLWNDQGFPGFRNFCCGRVRNLWTYRVATTESGTEQSTVFIIHIPKCAGDSFMADARHSVSDTLSEQ